MQRFSNEACKKNAFFGLSKDTKPDGESQDGRRAGVVVTWRAIVFAWFTPLPLLARQESPISASLLLHHTRRVFLNEIAIFPLGGLQDSSFFAKLCYPREQKTMTTSSKGPNGLGGWLILLILYFLYIGVIVFFRLSEECSALLQRGRWEELTTPGSMLYDFLPLIFLNDSGLIVLLILILVVIYLWFKMSYRFRMVAIAVIGLQVVLGVWAVFLISLIHTSTAQSVLLVSGATLLGQTIIAAAIWIPYLLFSRRVKNTFVRPPSDSLIQPNTENNE